MPAIDDLKPTHLDALREVANIGTGHATTVLSQMTNMRIMITAPEATVLPVQDVNEMFNTQGDSVVAIGMRMLGDLTGHTVLVMPRRNGRDLARLLLSREDISEELDGELEQSSLKEAGNVMAASFMNALATVAKMILLPSVPELIIHPPNELSAILQFSPDVEVVLCVKTNFSFADPEATGDDVGVQMEIDGAFLFLPDAPSLEALFAALQVR